MTAYSVLECDGVTDAGGECDARYDRGAANATEARRWAKRDGWRRDVDSHDFCPLHASRWLK